MQYRNWSYDQHTIAEPFKQSAGELFTNSSVQKLHLITPLCKLMQYTHPSWLPAITHGTTVYKA